MRWVLITAFGVPVEPEVNRNFATVSGVTRACAAATPAVSSGPSKSENNVALRFAGGLRVTTSSALPDTAAATARPNAPPSFANTRPGVSSSMIMRSRPKSPDSSE